MDGPLKGGGVGGGGQAVAAHHHRGVALWDNPHGNNFVLRRPLEEGPLEVVAVDHDQAITAASPQQLEEDREDHIAFIRRLVRRRLPRLTGRSWCICCSPLAVLPRSCKCMQPTRDRASCNAARFLDRLSMPCRHEAIQAQLPSGPAGFAVRPFLPQLLQGAQLW